jgi:hypothetical protein
MGSTTLRLFAASLFVSVAAAGCAVDAQGGAPGEGAPAETREDVGATSSAYSIWPQYQVPLAWQGGTGGIFDNVSQNCGSGNVVVGLWAQVRDYSASWSWVYQLGLICSHLGSDGTLSPAWSLTMTAGNPNGTHTAWSWCPAGQIAVGIYGQSATYVDGIELDCMPPSSVARGVRPGTVVSVNPLEFSSTVTEYLGGAGGNYFHDDCPAHYAVTSLTTRHGSWLDGVQANCDYLSP